MKNLTQQQTKSKIIIQKNFLGITLTSWIEGAWNIKMVVNKAQIYSHDGEVGGKLKKNNRLCKTSNTKKDS